MKIKLLAFSALTLITLAACGEQPANNSVVSPKPTIAPASNNPTPSPTPVPTSSITKDGDYEGKGIVTKIDLNAGSVEMDHEEIKNLMPAMRMEFYVSDKKMLDGLNVGDRVEFVIRYKAATETIVRLKKEQ